MLAGKEQYEQELEPLFYTWLKTVGLDFNPFAILDAGQDPDIPAYLVGHTDFEKLWGDWPAFIFAPAGGGKTAFRVRLARACRVGEDGRRVFPIVYHRLPAPGEIAEEHGQAIHLKNIARQAAQELLFWLAYHPLKLTELDNAALAAIRLVFDAHLPSQLDDYLDRLRYFGDLSPLAHEFDRTTSYLINPPGPQDVRLFCERMAQSLPKTASGLFHGQQFEHLINLLLNQLHFDAIYLLIDGVDAYPETASDSKAALPILDWLLRQTPQWAGQHIFAKFFLPAELENPLQQQMPTLLTTPSKVAIIEWSVATLVEVIQRRLSVASQGMYDSLDALSSPGLRGAEKKLARTVWPRVPRQMLILTERLLVEHVQRAGPHGKLEPQDLELACNWYAGQKKATLPLASSP